MLHLIILLTQQRAAPHRPPRCLLLLLVILLLLACTAGSYNLLPKAISDLRSQQEPSAREREQAVQSMNQLIRSKLVQVGSTARISLVWPSRGCTLEHGAFANEGLQVAELQRRACQLKCLDSNSCMQRQEA